MLRCKLLFESNDYVRDVLYIRESSTDQQYWHPQHCQHDTLLPTQRDKGTYSIPRERTGLPFPEEPTEEPHVLPRV